MPAKPVKVMAQVDGSGTAPFDGTNVTGVKL